MEKPNLTPEQIQEKFIDPSLTVLNFAIQQVDNETADEIIKQFKEAVSKLAPEKPVELDEVIDAPFKIAEEAVQLTPSEKDDHIVSAIVAVKDFILGGKGLFKLLNELIKAKKAAK